jgi:hypothetical protein
LIVATARTSADISATPEAISAVIADPLRLPAWEVSYIETSPLSTEPGEEPHFTTKRLLANREMRLVCRVEHAEPPTRFAFVCDGDAGEHVRQEIALRPSRDGFGTSVTLQSEFELGHTEPAADPLSVVPELTYTQAWLDRSVEQALARLGALVDAANNGEHRQYMT